MNDVRVLVVDDQPGFRAALRALLDRTPGFAIAGEASTGEEGVEAAVLLDPDLVLMDVNLPGISGIELVVGEANGKRTLTVRDAQHEYVFTES